MGPTGPTGAPGEAAVIESVQAVTGEPGSEAYAYNTGTPYAADFVFVIPAGMPGETGPTGPAGAAEEAVYGGLYNTNTGEAEVQPDEIAAMTFSSFYPALDVEYDGHHSIVICESGVYEIHYALRADSETCSDLHVAITNDGHVIPSSVIVEHVDKKQSFGITGLAVAELRAGAHLHFILYAKEYVKFLLHEGVNLMLFVKKLSDCE